jgi:hypothetical protein
MIAFRARTVAATQLPDLNSHVVVLAEHPDGGGARLEISCALTRSEQDRELGRATYSISTQTGATVYGGVISYSLGNSTLAMRLDSRAQETLGAPGAFSIVLEADAATVDGVRSALVSILGWRGGAP